MKNQKSLTNKGFSLVELIIVVAIMAILIGVLAPQYLRYVEKSRHQKDNTTIGEIADIIKMTSADETLITALGDEGTLTFDASGIFQGYTRTDGDATQAGLINADLKLTLGDFTTTDGQIKLTSNAYTKNVAAGSNSFTINVKVQNSVITVTSNTWKEAGATATSPKTF